MTFSSRRLSTNPTSSLAQSVLSSLAAFHLHLKLFILPLAVYFTSIDASHILRQNHTLVVLAYAQHRVSVQ
ncbi:hypothetical protein IQ07DRAFT_582489 [Pyrenochaeta sp. DS3sAY3a]|nr:hypothetical protein IQ07DRAFT_582489 [Pyrenochaeta sp. DS3sAY3a]